MNTIFWLLWLSDVVNGTGTIFGLTCCFSGILAALMGMMIAFAFDTTKNEIAVSNFCKNNIKKIITLCISCGIIAAILPSRETILVMVGTQATQTIAQSETGQKTLQAVNVALDKFIKENK